MEVCFEKATITHILNECECSKMVWQKLGTTDMSVTNLLDLTLRHSELELRSIIIAQIVFCKQVLPPDVLARVTVLGIQVLHSIGRPTTFLEMLD